MNDLVTRDQIRDLHRDLSHALTKLALPYQLVKDGNRLLLTHPGGGVYTIARLTPVDERSEQTSPKTGGMKPPPCGCPVLNFEGELIPHHRHDCPELRDPK